MKKILILLLLTISYSAFGQTKSVTDTVFTRYIKSKNTGINQGNGKVIIPDTVVFKNGEKQTDAFTSTLKSNYNSAYNFSHAHLNSGVLAGIKASDTTRWGQGGADSTIFKSNYQAHLDTTKLHNQIITKLSTTGTAANSALLQGKDSVYIKANWGTTGRPVQVNFESPYKIPFDNLNTQILPYTVSADITITPNTVNSFSGASTSADFIGDGTHTIYFSGFSAANSSAIDSFIPTNNYVSTYLFGKIGNYTYKYGLQNYAQVTEPITLNPPGDFQATSPNPNQINLSWTTIANAENYQLYDSIVGVSTNFTNLLTSPAQDATSYEHTGLSNGQTVYYRIRSVGDGVNYITSTYATTNATTSTLTQLSTPTLNSLTVVDSTQINLIWNQITNNDGYRIQRSTNGSSYTNLDTTAINDTTYSNTGLANGQIYYYKVRARGDSITYSDSPYSTAQNATTWGGFANLLSGATNTTGDSVTLTFNKVMATNPDTVLLRFSPSKTISSIARGTNTSTLKLKVSEAFSSENTITLNYSGSGITASDLGKVKPVTGFSITNNTESSSILFSDIFSGSTINTTTKWDLTNPNDGVIPFTQNNLISVTCSGSTASWADYLQTKNTYSSSILALKADMTRSGTSAGFCTIRFWKDENNFIMIYNQSGSTNTTLYIQQGGAQLYSANVSDDINGSWKIKKDGNSVSFWRWDTDQWVQKGTTQTITFGGDNLYGRFDIGYNNTGITITLDNYYITNADFSTQNP